MARLTVLLEDRENVLTEGNRFVGCGCSFVSDGDGYEDQATGGKSISRHGESPWQIRVP